MTQSKAPTSPQSEMTGSLPLGIFTVTYGTKSRCTIPAPLRKKLTQQSIWLLYDASKGRAIVVIDKESFLRDFPDLLLTEIAIDKQGKILLPEGFLTSHNISLVTGSPIRFVSIPGRDGKGVIEIYFSDEHFQNVAARQLERAEQVATILTAPPIPLRITQPTYAALELIGVDGVSLVASSETITLTS